MLTFTNYAIEFNSIPDEIAITFYINECPIHCQGCSSPWLWERGKYTLDERIIKNAIAKYPYVTCICLMGGDNNHNACIALAKFIRSCGKKVAMYSGMKWDNQLAAVLDYYKIGPWRRECGPLNSPTTNQAMYRFDGDKWTDITHLFQTAQNKWHSSQEKAIENENKEN